MGTLLLFKVNLGFQDLRSLIDIRYLKIIACNIMSDSITML